MGRFAAAAGCSPELEKAGLLPPGPDQPGASRRRPADVYLPSWANGAPAALDFAVTSPQRQEILTQAASSTGAAAIAYEAFKRDHLGTNADCVRQGLSFIPMVAEPSGGWGPTALATFLLMARAASVRTGQPTSAVYRDYLQRMCVSIRRAGARAVLRRDCEDASNEPPGRSAARALVAA